MGLTQMSSTPSLGSSVSRVTAQVPWVLMLMGVGGKLGAGLGKDGVEVSVVVDGGPGGLSEEGELVEEAGFLLGDYDGHVGEAGPVVGGVVGDGLDEALVEGDRGEVAGLVEGAVVGLGVWVVSFGDCPVVLDPRYRHGLFPPVSTAFCVW